MFRYSDANTYTDYPTRKQAAKARDAQGGGTIRKLTELECLVSRAKTALYGDSADAEHDVLFDLVNYLDTNCLYLSTRL